MSEILIFGVGSVMFIAVTWAAVAFGVQRMHDLQVADLEDGDQTAVTRDDGLTELHVPESEGPDTASFSSASRQAGSNRPGNVIRYRPRSE